MHNYIEKIKQPNYLDENMINCKEIFFYFKKTFLAANKVELELKNYNNNHLNKDYKNILSTFFDIREKINIKTHESNFFHLIGYGNNENMLFKFKNEDFLLDYKKYGFKIEKIKSISWIIDTLNKPTFIFTSDGIKKISKVNADLVFVRKQFETYHYVGLKKISKECALKNDYVINSHHPLVGVNAFHKMFKKERAIYIKRFKVKVENDRS